MGDDTLSAIAVIPARGGSKRLPRKALFPFLGEPMIVHAVRAAQDSGCFADVKVSSDDAEILDVAQSAGATPYRRSPELAQDDTPTAPVLLDVLENEERHHRSWDILACIYATAPLRTAEDIRSVIDMIEPGECDFAMAVCEADRPVHQALKQSASGHLEAAWPDLLNTNSQQAPRFVFGNGSTYAVHVPAFLKEKSLYGSTLCGYEMPRSRSVDLDSEEDLMLLNYFAQRAGHTAE